MKWLSLVLALMMLLGGAAMAGERTLKPGEVLRLIDGEAIDLDGDGTAEQVRIAFGKPDEYGQLTSFQLDVGGAQASDSGDGLNLTGEVWALRMIGTGDVLLLVGDWGPSSDDTSYVYCYQEGALLNLGEIGTLPQNITVSPGLFTGLVRGWILQTWYRPGDFALARDWDRPDDPPRIVRVPRAVYPMGTVVTLRHDIDLLAAPESDAPAVLGLKSGAQAVLAASDDVAWVYVEAAKDVEGEWTAGWFFVGYDSWTTIPVGDWHLPPTEVFGGLVYAD